MINSKLCYLCNSISHAGQNEIINPIGGLAASKNLIGFFYAENYD